MDEKPLDFYNVKPNNEERISKIASEILQACQGKTYEDIMDRLSAKFSPKEVLKELEECYAGGVGLGNEEVLYFIEKLRKRVNVSN